MNDERFDELLEEIRRESVPPEQIKATQDRVWRRLQAACSLACEEIRPHLEGYAHGRLSESRRLLVHDHVSRCVDCRHVLATIKADHTLVVLPQARRAPQRKWQRLAVAAGIVIAVLYIGRAGIDSALTPSGPRATVVSVSGTLVDLSRGELTAGAELSDGETVRTAADSGAVLRLDDGSLLEMNERSELSVSGAWSGNTIRLERGDLIVEAADQRAGRLRVVTRDSIASVRGTVFAVSSGTAGSLVSVIEGSVEVSQPGFEELLGAGQQAATHTAFGEVSVEEAISWSSEAADYAALLSGLIQIEERLVGAPGLRYQADLVSFLPAQTTAYFAFPNIEGAASETLDLLEQRSAENEWWVSDEAQRMREVLARMQDITPMLGEEIVFVLSGESLVSDGVMPLMMAQVQSGRDEELGSAFEGLAETLSEPIPYQISDGILLVADSPANLALMSAQIGAGSSSPLATEVTNRYGRGVGWLAALDVRTLDLDSSGENLQEALGIDNMSYLFLEQRTDTLGDDTAATLMFDGPRKGVASWIGEPGPIGSAEYVSSEALIASSGSTRDPSEAFDQLLMLFGSSSEFVRQLQEVELETGVDISNDVVSSLGTDFVVAIEQISVPSLGWIAALEVLNSGALEEAMRRMVTTINSEMAAEDADERVILARETVNGRTWSSLAIGNTGTTLHWTYDRGYLIASIDRALALRAIGVRDSGSSLVRSSAFQAQFPRDGGLHSSGFFWLNIADVAADLASVVDEPSINALASSRDPVLVVLTGEADQVRWASRTRFTSFLLDLMFAQPIGDRY